MRVSGPGNIPGYGPGGADRAGRDGQRKGGHPGQQQQQQQPKAEQDEVQLQGPEGKGAPAKPSLPLKANPPPAKPGKRPPLDLSA